MAEPENSFPSGEEELQIIFDSVPAMIFYKDRENRLVRVNQLYCRTLGLDKDAIEGKSAFELTPNRELAETYWKDDKEIIETGVPKLNIVEPLITDESRWFRTYKIPYRDKNGEIIGIIGFSIDITDTVKAEKALREAQNTLEKRVEERTEELARSNEELQREIAERKKAEEELTKSKQMLEKTFRSLLDAIFILDAESSRIIECNAAAAVTFDYPREELIGKTIDFLHVNEQSLEEFRQILHKAIAKEGYLYLKEFRMKRQNGEVFPTEHSVIPIVDESGKTSEWVSVVRDITESKNAEMQLKEYNEMLETERVALREKNTALKEILNQIEDEKIQIAQNLQSNVDRVIMPLLRKLEDRIGQTEKEYLFLLRESLTEITSPFISKLETRFPKLTPREAEICNMIKNGMSSKEIALTLNASVNTINNHRKNIRRKLNITDEKANLCSILRSL
ncbi:MAG: PAS domain S-box protein [candidate division Zixibacteria bacterium]|nr:PAS domain S-box protein [candidate division Zixibacteria bacterium]